MASPCPAGFVLSDGACIDPSNDPEHCGASGDCEGDDAGKVCTPEPCIEGQCGGGCPAGQILCGSECISPLTDPNHCGVSGDCKGVNAGAICAPGGGEGVCPGAAGQVCSGGKCVSYEPGSR